MMYENSQSGRSMIEVMGYMAAVMAVVAGISKLLSGVYAEYKISKGSIQLAELAGAITKSSAIDANYTTIIGQIKGTDNDKKLNEEGRKLIPTSYRVVANTDGTIKAIKNVFGGEVQIGIPEEGKFSITFEGLTREQCVEMAMKEWEHNKIVDLDSIIINGTYHWYWPIYSSSTPGAYQLPTTRSALTGKDLEDKGQCSKDKGNNITWVFN